MLTLTQPQTLAFDCYYGDNKPDRKLIQTYLRQINFPPSCDIVILVGGDVLDAFPPGQSRWGNRAGWSHCGHSVCVVSNPGWCTKGCFRIMAFAGTQQLLMTAVQPRFRAVPRIQNLEEELIAAQETGQIPPGPEPPAPDQVAAVVEKAASVLTYKPNRFSYHLRSLLMFSRPRRYARQLTRMLVKSLLETPGDWTEDGDTSDWLNHKSGIFWDMTQRQVTGPGAEDVWLPFLCRWRVARAAWQWRLQQAISNFTGEQDGGHPADPA